MTYQPRLFDTKEGNDGVWTIREMPETERPVSRLQSHGAQALSDSELLTIITGAKSITPARELLNHLQGDIARLDKLERIDIRGLGKISMAKLKACLALNQRINQRRMAERPGIESPIQVAEIMREVFRDKEQEEFHALLLNTKHALLRDVLITVGLVDRSQVHAREVFRNAIRAGCSRMILCHNHPSGDPTPSAQDISCTKNLVSAGKVIGIEVLDHVILGKRSEARPRDFLSFREENLI